MSSPPAPADSNLAPADVSPKGNSDQSTGDPVDLKVNGSTGKVPVPPPASNDGKKPIVPGNQQQSIQQGSLIASLGSSHLAAGSTEVKLQLDFRKAVGSIGEKFSWADDDEDFFKAVTSDWLLSLQRGRKREILRWSASSFGDLSVMQEAICNRLGVDLSERKLECTVDLSKAKDKEPPRDILRACTYLAGFLEIFSTSWMKRLQVENSPAGDGFREAGRRLMHSLAQGANKGYLAKQVFGVVGDSLMDRLTPLIKVTEADELDYSLNEMLKALSKAIHISRKRDLAEAFWMPSRKSVVIAMSPMQTKEIIVDKNTRAKSTTGKGERQRISVPIQPIITKRWRAYLTANEDKVIAGWNRAAGYNTMQLERNLTNPLWVECETAQLLIKQLSDETAEIRRICRSRKGTIANAYRAAHPIGEGQKPKRDITAFIEFAKTQHAKLADDKNIIALKMPNIPKMWAECEAQAKAGATADLSCMHANTHGSDNDEDEEVWNASSGERS